MRDDALFAQLQIFRIDDFVATNFRLAHMPPPASQKVNQ